MPERMLRDLTDSDAYNGVDATRRDMFIRLINKADDYGCFFGDAKRLRPALYPLLLDQVREPDLERWLRDLEAAGLVRLYTHDGKLFVWIAKWRQRLRSKHRKYPTPPWESAGGAASSAEPPPDTPPPPVGHMTGTCPADVGHVRTETNTESKSRAGANACPPEQKPEVKTRRPAWERAQSSKP